MNAQRASSFCSAHHRFVPAQCALVSASKQAAGLPALQDSDHLAQAARPGIREQRWQALAYLSSMMPQALLLFFGPELLAHHHLLVILFLVFYVFALMRIAPTKPDGSGQWMLPSEAKTLESNVFGLPLPLLGILVAILLARQLTLLPPMGIVCMAIVLCAISVFANMMASRSARRAKHDADTAPDTPPPDTPPTPLC